MKKNKKLNRKIYLLIILLTGLALGSCIIAVKASLSDFTFDIEELKGEIQSSDGAFWKNPAQNRKDAICNKLTTLQDLINEQNFEEAYNKLLYDIKPKLTGLKRDENEEPWGNGVYDQAWVTCEGLRGIFNTKCDLILSEINPLAVYDDDKTPPEISIIYEGEQYINDPGVWHVNIEDLESGLDIIIIDVNGIKDIYELYGVLSTSYDVPVPAIAGINTIIVTAINNDKDFIGDQETGTETEWVIIFEDTTPPVIDQPEDIAYEYMCTGKIITWVVSDDHPDTYTVLLDGGIIESGMWDSGIPIEIGVDGLSIGIYEFMITVNDTYDNYAEDIVFVDVQEDDDTSNPIMDYIYTGDGSDGNPGEIIMVASDESGLSIDPSGTYPIPASVLTHNFVFTATDNDNDRPDDSLSTTVIIVITICDDDNTPPIISIIYYGSGFDDNPGYFEWIISDTDDGIGGDHDSGFSELIVKGKYESTVGLPEEEFLLTPTETGTWNLPSSPGTYTLNITAFDNDDDRTLETDALLANLIQEETIADDDVTPPSISIQYDGEGHTANPGVWHVDVGDLESGLDEVEFLINGVQELYDQGLGGTISKSYDILVPDVVGEYTLTVVAKNNDNDWNGDQEQDTDTYWVEIIFDDDFTAPIISLSRYSGKRYREWRVFIEDLESGLDEILVEIDGNVHIHDTNLDGIISLSYYNILIPGEVGVHSITITAKNNDKDYAGDQETSTYLDSYNVGPSLILVDDDYTSPTISIAYEGGNVDINPGVWHIDVEDLESGLAEVLILVNGISVIDDQGLGGIISMHYDVSVPATAGIQTITITAKNNDIDFSGDQESYTRSHIADIEPSAILPPDDDNTGPTIVINYVENGYGKGYWRVYIEDIESGLDKIQILIDGIQYVHDQNLNGIQSKLYQFWVLATIERSDTGEGSHTIDVVAVNNDKDYAGDEEISTAFDSMCVDNTPPTIEMQYSGPSSTAEPGLWDIYILDYESGIDEVYISVDGNEVIYDYNGETVIHLEISVPGTEGLHTIDITAVNNDKDYDGDQESSTVSDQVTIIYVPPIIIP